MPGATLHHLRLLLSTIAVAALFVACPEPTPADGPGTADCATSADCREAGTTLGGVCSGGDCVVCDSADDCVADDVYGADATCIEGRCTVCAPGEVGCACLDDSYCLEGEGCRDGLCRPCDAGDALCPCTDDASCSGGLVCQDDRCVTADCAPGSEGCVCVDDGCDGDLVCGNDVCRACPSDVAGCPCAEGDTCGNDLVCDDDSGACRPATACTELSCGTARLCSVVGAVARCLDECATGFVYDAATDSCVEVRGANCDAGAQGSILASCDAQHRVCVPGNDTASCGACDATANDCFVGPADPALGECRAPTTCATCDADHRTCTTAPVCGDVVCTGCIDGFFEYGGVCTAIENVTCDVCDAANRDCLANDDGNFCGQCSPFWQESGITCVPVDNCVAGAENSILDRCDFLNRDCVEATPGVPAVCGPCPADTVENADQVCVQSDTCSTRDECGGDLFCLQRSRQDQAKCIDPEVLACEPNEFFNRFASGGPACQNCTLACTDTETSGVQGIWPVSNAEGQCICNTKPGFFWDAAVTARKAVKCDEDGDGWVNEAIFGILRTAVAAGDVTTLLSINCPIPFVETIALQNEWGQRLELNVNEDLRAEGDVILFETLRNDKVGVTTSTRPGAPSVRVAPQSINSLTKMCNRFDDFNDNGTSDVLENQQDTSAVPWRKAFNQLTYFSELYEGSYDSGTRTYTIRERARKDAEAPEIDTDGPFPFAYYATNDPDSDNWRCCTRRRDARYDIADTTGYDFADRACDYDSDLNDEQTNGACAYSWPAQWNRSGLSSTPPPAVLDLPDGRIPSYDVCDADHAPPDADEFWRGMTHYSQFRCAQVINDPVPVRELVLSEVLRSDLYTGPLGARLDASISSSAPWLVQACTLAADGTRVCAPEADEADVVATENQVTWLARRYDLDYDYVPNVVEELTDNFVGYSGGCIDEKKEMPELCPGQVDNPDGVFTSSAETDFGELSCGCGINFGGLNCERACADRSFVHASEDYDPDVRTAGTWTCTEVAASGFDDGQVFDGDVDGAAVVIDAKVPIATAVSAGTALSGTVNGDEYSIR